MVRPAAARAGLVGAGRDARVAPPLAGQRHEPPAVGRPGPGPTLPRFHRPPGRQVDSQAHEAHVPADADRTGAELGPSLVVHRGDVLEHQPGPALQLTRMPGADPGSGPVMNWRQAVYVSRVCAGCGSVTALGLRVGRACLRSVGVPADSGLRAQSGSCPGPRPAHRIRTRRTSRGIRTTPYDLHERPGPPQAALSFTEL